MYSSEFTVKLGEPSSMDPPESIKTLIIFGAFITCVGNTEVGFYYIGTLTKRFGLR